MHGGDHEEAPLVRKGQLGRRWIWWLPAFLWSCDIAPTRSLDELTVVDSTYVVPETGEPYSGNVTAQWPERLGGRSRLEAGLVNGTWEGEFTLYHPTGRIRSKGWMSGGAPCGGWVENENPTVPESMLQEVTEELESLVIYGDCPEG